MKELKITKNQLLEQYNKVVDNILDTCDWKTSFSGEEVCGIVYGILSKNDIEHPMLIEEFHVLYSKKCSTMAASDEEWRNNFNVPKIIDIVYELLTT